VRNTAEKHVLCYLQWKHIFSIDVKQINLKKASAGLDR